MTIPQQRTSPLGRPTSAGLSMACYLEINVDRTRRAAWHADCVRPASCPCPGHGVAEVVKPS